MITIKNGFKYIKVGGKDKLALNSGAYRNLNIKVAEDGQTFELSSLSSGSVMVDPARIRLLLGLDSKVEA